MKLICLTFSLTPFSALMLSDEQQKGHPACKESCCTIPKSLEIWRDPVYLQKISQLNKKLKFVVTDILIK